jgi:hypothetical protein
MLGLSGGTLGYREGKLSRAIEERTALLPSGVFLWAAGAAIVGSAVLQVAKRRELSNFVGQWAPTFLGLGLYNKLVKVLG